MAPNPVGTQWRTQISALYIEMSEIALRPINSVGRSFSSFSSGLHFVGACVSDKCVRAAFSLTLQVDTGMSVAVRIRFGAQIYNIRALTINIQYENYPKW